ncbi:MAG: hypothetical protein ACK2UW_18410 [Anaerolineales bacterium]|jgi:hypothetical protein
MLNSATLISIVLFLAGLLLWLAGMRIGHYSDRLVQAIGRERTASALRVLIILPLVIVPLTALMLVLIYGIADPQLLTRLAHVSLVLGAWMAGILGAFMFLFPYRLKLDFPLPALLVCLLTVPIAIYLAPLARFWQIFGPTGQAGLGAAAGVFSMVLAELVLIVLRRSL